MNDYIHNEYFTLFIFFSLNVIANIDLQVNDNLSKITHKKKHGNPHKLDGYYYSILMMMQPPKITKNAKKLKRSSFSLKQIHDETRDNTFKKENEDTDGFTNDNSM